MKSLQDGLKALMASFGTGEDTGARARRAAAVNVMWRKAVEAVYKDAATIILQHINAVYIMRADDIDDARVAARVTDGGTVLVVYSDDSMVRSDLDARQEFLKMKLNEQGEHVEAFSIKPSRFDMKTRHPFRVDPHGNNQGGLPTAGFHQTPQRALSTEELDSINQRLETVEHPAVRSALKRAMTADFQRKTSQEVKKDTEL